jgi:hypothetical protein
MPESNVHQCAESPLDHLRQLAWLNDAMQLHLSQSQFEPGDPFLCHNFQVRCLDYNFRLYLDSICRVLILTSWSLLGNVMLLYRLALV